MSASIRKIKNKDGSISQMLDVSSHGVRTRELLHHLKLLKPANALDRVENKKKEKYANDLLLAKMIDMATSEHGLVNKDKQNTFFIEFYQSYLDKYTLKDKRVIAAALSQFKAFLPTIDKDVKITTKEVTEEVVYDFKCYLESKLKGESPSTYFKRFKKVLKYGVKQKYFASNPSTDVIIKENTTSIKKDTLTMEEIKLLAATPITNNELRRAFLFSCLTGVRFVDVNAITHKAIKGKRLEFKQSKTSIDVSINLNEDALSLLGTGSAEQKIFALPSHTACNKGLKHWAAKAGINKHLTFHVGRHSFATNLIFHGANVLTTSKLLGHTSLRFTERYVRIADSQKEDAVNNLPSIK